MSVIRTRVVVARWPLVRRMPLRRFFLKTRIFGPRVSPSTTAMTRALATKGSPPAVQINLGLHFVLPEFTIEVLGHREA